MWWGGGGVEEAAFVPVGSTLDRYAPPLQSLFHIALRSGLGENCPTREDVLATRPPMGRAARMLLLKMQGRCVSLKRRERGKTWPYYLSYS